MKYLKQYTQRIGVLPLVFLIIAYGLLALTFTEHLSHSQIMTRCVLVNPDLSRIWSVDNIEIGIAYFGIFTAMALYIIRSGECDKTHLADLIYGLGYILGSFVLDVICVMNFKPFEALLIGDAIVMTFTVLVSQQLWFQRLLGVFIPLVFLTCGVGHFLEGLSYWKLTYPINVPWMMITADIGFAVLVNVTRFPAFLRGGEIVDDLKKAQEDQAAQQTFFSEVLQSATQGKLSLHYEYKSFPQEQERIFTAIVETKLAVTTLRKGITDFLLGKGYNKEFLDRVETCAGEVLMNAVVHGNHGRLRVCTDGEILQIWVLDSGEGIPINSLHKATLTSGWSSKNTMGMGYTLIISEADHVDLMTSTEGTIVLLTFYRNGPPSGNIPEILLRELNSPSDLV